MRAKLLPLGENPRGWQVYESGFILAPLAAAILSISAKMYWPRDKTDSLLLGVYSATDSSPGTISAMENHRLLAGE